MRRKGFRLAKQKSYLQRVTTIAFLIILASGLTFTTAVASSRCNGLIEGKCFAKLSTGIIMAYVETGPPTGPNVILIHGLTDSLRSWSLSMAELHRLDPNLHILAVDQRGHGSSSMPEKQACAAIPENAFALRISPATLLHS